MLTGELIRVWEGNVRKFLEAVRSGGGATLEEVVKLASPAHTRVDSIMDPKQFIGS